MGFLDEFFEEKNNKARPRKARINGTLRKRIVSGNTS